MNIQDGGPQEHLYPAHRNENHLIKWKEGREWSAKSNSCIRVTNPNTETQKGRETEGVNV